MNSVASLLISWEDTEMFTLHLTPRVTVGQQSVCTRHGLCHSMFSGTRISILLMNLLKCGRVFFVFCFVFFLSFLNRCRVSLIFKICSLSPICRCLLKRSGWLYRAWDTHTCGRVLGVERASQLKMSNFCHIDGSSLKQTYITSSNISSPALSAFLSVSHTILWSPNL